MSAFSRQIGDGAFKDESSRNAKQEAKKIPAEVIRKAKGLVVFNILRAGLWESGAGGSGVVVSRLKDGSWSYPAAIKLSTPEVGVVLGVDIFDCVLVLNTQQSLDAFKRGFCVLGGDNYSVTGPLDVGWFLEADDRSRNAPIFSYFRSQKYYAGVQAVDFAFNARDDENQNFYSPQRLSIQDILAGQVRSPPTSLNSFMTCLKASQGDGEFDDSQAAPPSDFSMIDEGHSFAIPDIEDPDQYGYAALEKQGILVVDAATKSPVSAEAFEFHPSFKSPAFEKYHRKGDNSSISGRSSWRQSTMGSADRHDNASVRSIRSGTDRSVPPSPAFASPEIGQIQLEDAEEQSQSGYGHSAEADAYFGGASVEAREPTNGMAATKDSDRPSMRSKPLSPLAAEDTSDATKSHGRSASTATTRTHTRVESANVVSDNDSTNEPSRHEGQREQQRASHDTLRETFEERLNDDDESTDKPEDDNDSDTFEDPDEEFEIHDASASQPTPINQTGATAVSVSKAKVVTVPKAMTPSLPLRNPGRLTMMRTPSTDQVPQTDTGESPDDDDVNANTAMADRKQVPLPNDEDKTRPDSPEPTTENDRPHPQASLAGMRKGLSRSPSPDQSPDR